MVARHAIRRRYVKHGLANKRFVSTRELYITDGVSARRITMEAVVSTKVSMRAYTLWESFSRNLQISIDGTLSSLVLDL